MTLSTHANAYSLGSGACLQDLDTTTAVSVTTSGSNCVLTFNYSGTTTIWTVPSLGLSNISFTIKGSKGGGSVGDAGYGANFSGVIPTLAGSSQLYINVGGAGTSNGSGLTGGGFNGGGAGGYNGGTGGGGATDIRFGSNSAADRKIVAGGGGGASGVSANFVSGSNANGATGGTAGTSACSGSAGQNSSSGGAGGASTCRNAGGGGGGYAGGGGAGNNANGSNNGGHGGNGSSYWDPTFVTVSADCGSGCTFWNNGTSNTNFDYSKYTNSTTGSLILTFAPNVTSTMNTISVSGNLIYRKVTTLSVSVNMPAYVTFRANKAKIPGCIKKLAVGSGNSYIATCAWSPSTRGSIAVSAAAVPVDSQYLASSSPTSYLLVSNRSGNR